MRQKGEAFNLEKQTQQAVATMCFAGVAEEDLADESRKVCPWWKKGTCRWGPRCKWIHEGPAGVAAVARSKKAPVGKEKSPVGSKMSSVNADLKAMLLELFAGLATSLNCPVRRLLTKICGRLQTPRNCMRVTQSRRSVPVKSQPVPVGSRSCPQIGVYQSGIRLSVVNEKQKVNQSKVRPDASLVRADSVLSDHPDSDPRSRPSAPCDIKAGTSMVSSEINLDIPFNKTSLLQESHCLNTKIIKDNDVEVSEVTVKVSEVDVQGVVDFIEARLHQGVDATHTHTVPIVKPLGAAHQGLCQSQECDGKVINQPIKYLLINPRGKYIG